MNRVSRKVDECAHCATAFIQKNRGHVNKFCSSKCFHDSTATLKSTIRACAVCLEHFVPKRKTQKACSESCAKKIRIASSQNRRKSKETRGRGPYLCKGCGTLYRTTRSRGEGEKFCSRECSFAWLKKNPRFTNQILCSTCGKGVAQSQIYLGQYCSLSCAPCVDCGIPTEGKRCQLCGIKTPKSAKGKQRNNSPELDHIQPLSVGGDHTWDNCQCACRQCNITKRNRPLGQQRLSLGAPHWRDKRNHFSYLAGA